ncbi:MAG: GNAT family N-acetyltransferase [Anaerolineae bacterium]|nr:GNAT family N-acetyltransferase [Anaerolineae bacterium]
MYGVESCVHPEYRGRGVGSLLMDARFDVLRRLNLRGLIAGSIPMDYHTVAASMTIEDYVREVVEGLRFDTNLSKQLHKGFQVHNLIPGYIHDARSRNWAVAIVWDNPAYQPSKIPDAPLFEVPRLYRTRLKSGRRVPAGAAGS